LAFLRDALEIYLGDANIFGGRDLKNWLIPFFYFFVFFCFPHSLFFCPSAEYYYYK
jgi:hypothetical protein